MSPTWLEIAVAILLLWLAWQIGVIVAPMVLRRFRSLPPETNGDGSPAQETSKTIHVLKNKDQNGP